MTLIKISVPTRSINFRKHNLGLEEFGLSSLEFLTSSNPDRKTCSYTLATDIPEICVNCGKLVILGDRNGTITSFNECDYPEPPTTHQTQVLFPTGQIVFSDSLFDRFPLPQQPYTLNSVKGQFDFYDKCATMNLAFGCVENTSPTVFWEPKTNTLHVVELAYNYVTDKKEPKPHGWVKLGKITTDLWGFSIADKQTYYQQPKTPPVSQTPKEAQILPGTYQFTYYAEGEREGTEEPVAKRIVYATATLLP